MSVQNPYATPLSAVESGGPINQSSIYQVLGAMPTGLVLGVLVDLLLFGASGSATSGNEKLVVLMMIAGVPIVLLMYISHLRTRLGTSAGVFFGQLFYWLVVYKGHMLLVLLTATLARLHSLY